MEYTVTTADGILVGWARSPRLAEELIEQDRRDHPERDCLDYQCHLTYDDDDHVLLEPD